MAEQKQEAQVSEEKIAIIKELVELMKNKNTIMFASIKGLPAAQFQKIKKSLGKEVNIKVIKKRALIRAIDESGKEDLQKLKEYAKEDIAILISDSDAFELSETLSKNTSPVKAKTGQEAQDDIEIEAGPTSLPAGPAVSELGSIGLTVKINNGKIEILEPRVVVKKGKIINEEVAGVLGKLDMTPFSVGFIPLVAFDSASGNVFTQLNVDKEGTINEMKNMFAKLRSFAVNLGYISAETIGMLLAKAGSHEKALSGLVNEDKAESEEKVVEEKEEEKAEEEKKEEAEVEGEEKAEEEKKEEVVEKSESNNAPKSEETK